MDLMVKKSLIDKDMDVDGPFKSGLRLSRRYIPLRVAPLQLLDLGLTLLSYKRT
jgi:hypothetical protein